MSGVDMMGRRRALIETSNLAKIDERKKFAMCRQYRTYVAVVDRRLIEPAAANSPRDLGKCKSEQAGAKQRKAGCGHHEEPS